MQFKFIAINGDNIGDSIGNAIASDNHEELSKITGGLKNAHGAVEKWVQSVGGKVITSSGDEGIYKVPADSFDESTLESLREQYSQSTGATITVGIGDSMSEASKALIYGKLNDKDQVVEYDPHIDDYIASHDEEIPDDEMQDDSEVEGELPSEDEMQDQADEDMEASAGLGQDSEEDDFEEDDSEGADFEEQDGDIVMDADDAVDEHEELVDTLRSPSHEDDLEAADEQESELEEYEEVAEDNEDETLAEQGDMSEEDLAVDPEEQLEEVVGEDIDEDGDGVSDGVDLDGDGDIDSVTASDESLDQEGFGEGEEEIGEEEIGEEEIGEEGDERQGAISDMIHANMGGEEEIGEEGDDEELRQDIVNSLMTFKENKAMLEQAKTQNPKLYEATILMLRSMIEMAKKLKMNPESDMEGQEVQDAIPDAEMDEMEGQEEMPEVDMADEGLEEEASQEMDEEEFEDEDEALPAAKPKPFGKSEVAKLYSDLIKGMEVLQKVKGVHLPDSKDDPKSGRSKAGKFNDMERQSKQKRKGKGTAWTSTFRGKKIDQHRRKLSELKGMNKPNLPKSETSVVKNENWRNEQREKDKKRRIKRKVKGVKNKKPTDRGLKEVERRMGVKQVSSGKK